MPQPLTYRAPTMLPITTKPTTNEFRDADSFRVWSRKRTRTVQKAPFNLPLPFLLEEGLAYAGGSLFTGVLGGPGDNAEQIIGQCKSPTMSGLMTDAANISYERFRDGTATTASLGVNFVEYRQSISMIASRAGAMLDAYRKVRRLDFVGAARVLTAANPGKVNPNFPKTKGWYPKGVHRTKSAGSNWLEYHFGWAPLVKDVYASMEVLHNPVKKFASIKGTGKTYANFDSGWLVQGSTLVKNTYRWEATHKQGAFVNAVTNAPLHTLEQLGLTNPLSLAWEVVPFSFVVDWFINVGDVLRSYSDFAGMSLTNAYSVSIARTTHTRTVRANLPGFPTSLSSRNSGASGLVVVRSMGLTKPVFSVRPLRLPSLTRATTAISLLVQGLKGR